MYISIKKGDKDKLIVTEEHHSLTASNKIISNILLARLNLYIDEITGDHLHDFLCSRSATGCGTFEAFIANNVPLSPSSWLSDSNPGDGEEISETLVFNSTLTWLITRENFSTMIDTYSHSSDSGGKLGYSGTVYQLFVYI
jgi:hypothetical protein